jgi:hypothetical protein
MRFVLLMSLTLLTFLACAMFYAQAEDTEATPNPTPAAQAVEGRDIVTFSDGKTLTGQVFFKGVNKVRVFNEEQNNYIDLAVSDIAIIDVTVEKATMEKVWRFKEEGSPEKIFTGEEYPLHYYVTTFTLTNGTMFDTHFASVLYLRSKEGGKEHDIQLFCLLKQAGTTTQQLTDLVYLKRIEFFNRKAVRGGGAIFITANGKDKPRILVAVAWTSGTNFYAYPKDGVMSLSDLPPDRFDLFVATDSKIIYNLSSFGPDSAGNGDGDLEDIPEKPVGGESAGKAGGLTEEDRIFLTKFIATSEEFFDYKEAVAFGGHEKDARALVKQKRINETSYGTEAKKITLWRYDIWFLHKLDKEWKSDRRAFVWRGYLPQGDESGVAKPTVEPAFGAVDLRKPGAKFAFELK